MPCEGRTRITDPNVRETPVRTCMSATSYVIVQIVVAPRPPGRLRRAGSGGRGRSDPPFSMPAVASAEVGMCTPSQPSAAGRSGPSIPCGKAKRRAGTGASQPWSAMPDSPAARWSGNGSSSASKRLPTPFRDGLLAGSDPAAAGGWGCPAPSPLAPIEVCPRWGSLPATSRERGPASALRWPWCNRKRASDMDDRGRVRPNDHFVSGDPQSEPDTQDLPPTPVFGAQNGFSDRRLERHPGEDVGGRDAIGVRLRLGDNPVADSAADTRAVTALAGPSRASGPSGLLVEGPHRRRGRTGQRHSLASAALSCAARFPAYPVPLGDRRSSLSGDPTARRVPEDAPEPAETASGPSMEERRLRTTRKRPADWTCPAFTNGRFLGSMESEWSASPWRRGAAGSDPRSGGGSPGVRTRVGKRSAAARSRAGRFWSRAGARISTDTKKGERAARRPRPTNRASGAARDRWRTRFPSSGRQPWSCGRLPDRDGPPRGDGGRRPRPRNPPERGACWGSKGQRPSPARGYTGGMLADPP